MTRVCLLGKDDVDLRYELVSRETSREALATHDLAEPYENAVAVETISLGAAVSLCNDLNWYLVRFVDEALVFEPSVSDEEWLSRDLAEAIRDDEVAPEASDRYLKVYGVVHRDGDSSDDDAGPDGDQGDVDEDGGDRADPHGDDERGPPRLVEPMFVTRTGPDLPSYDLRDVEETLVVRLTAEEFGA